MKQKITFFFYTFILLATIVVMAVFCLSINKNTTFAKINNTERVKDEILIKYNGNDELYNIKIAQAEDFLKILDSLNKRPDIEYAEPNYLYNASLIPSDTYYGKQWYLEKIKAPQAWNIVRESKNVVIAIIDSGVQIDHPD